MYLKILSGGLVEMTVFVLVLMLLVNFDVRRWRFRSRSFVHMSLGVYGKLLTFIKHLF